MRFSEKLHALFPFAIAAALSISPFLVVPLSKGAGFYDNHRLVEVGCAVLALLVIFLKFMLNSLFPLILERKKILLIGLFFLSGFFSIFFSYSPRHALFEWSNFLLLLAVSWLIASELAGKSGEWLDRLLLVCGIGCAFYILISILIYVSILKTGIQPDIRTLIVGYDNYRFFNHVQTISLPLLGLLAARMPARDRQLIWWCVVSLWWMLLFVGAGRGTLLGLLSGVAIALLVLRRKALAWCISFGLSGLAGLLAYLVLYVVLPVQRGLEPFGLLFSRVARSVQDDPSSGRFPLWARAWEMIQAHPWTGAGPAHFAHEARDLPYGAHPHNWVLQVGSEWGLPALFFLCLLLVLAFQRLCRLRTALPEGQEATLTAWLVAGGAILVDGLFSGLIVMPVSQLWIALYLGCAWGWVASCSLPVQTVGCGLRLSGKCMAGLAFVVLAGALVCGIWPELQEQRLLKEAFPQEFLFRPRILGHGSF